MLNNAKPPVEVPISALSDDVLSGIINEFIMREGTDYGAVEASLETKVSQIKKQLSNKDILIVFDPNTESVTLLTNREYKKILEATK